MSRNRLLAMELQPLRIGEAFQNGSNQNRLFKMQEHQLQNEQADRDNARGQQQQQMEGRFFGALTNSIEQAGSPEEAQSIYKYGLGLAQEKLQINVDKAPDVLDSGTLQRMKFRAESYGFKFKEPKAIQPTKIERLQNYHDRLPEGDPRRANVLAAIQKESGGGEPKPQGFTLSEGQTRFDQQGNSIASVAEKATSLGNSKSDIKVNEEERKQAVKVNSKRIAELNNSKASRSGSIRKARRFLRAFKSNDNEMLDNKKAESGATRGFLNSTVFGVPIAPGIFTDQGQFDEELDAFAEVAAREKLKAVGEIRPTDSDVEGMKRAMFGVGRDEKTNINLLEEFINGQQAIDDELDDLLELKTAGRLDTFIDFESGRPQVNLPEGVTEEDIQHTMQVHGVSREAVLQRLQQ